RAGAASPAATTPAARCPRPARLTPRGRERAHEEALVGDLVRELEADVLLDRLQAVDVVLAREAHRLARCTGPRRSSNAVYVVLRVEGQIVVDDVRHPVDVETPR